RKLLLAEQRDLGPELGEAGRHLVADAHHVADGEARGHADVDAAHARRRGAIQVARLEVALGDQLVALAELLALRARDGLDVVGLVLERRHRDGERVTAALAGARELERLAPRLRGPT